MEKQMITNDIRRVDIIGKTNTECITFVTICQKLKFENINFFRTFIVMLHNKFPQRS